jgi:N-acetylmuramoyl-L-alanine amidase
MRKIYKIILHCSDTPENKTFTAKDIDNWHKERGFKAEYNGVTYYIGYHFVILLDGTVENGRPIELIGAHCEGQNYDSIGICYIGGNAGDKDKTPKDTRTLKQKISMKLLIEKLQTDYKISKLAVYGHNEFNPTKACPSFDVKKEFREK